MNHSTTRNTLGRHITYEQRKILSQMLEQGKSKSEIAEVLGICLSSLYNELKRGTINGNYDPNYAEEKKQINLREKGPQAILENNQELVTEIARLILEEHLSPERIIQRFKQERTFAQYPLSDRTIYVAIDKGYIPNVTRESLNINTTHIFNDVLRFPMWFREKMGIHNGDIFRFEANNDGQIILTKVGRNEETKTQR